MRVSGPKSKSKSKSQPSDSSSSSDSPIDLEAIHQQCLAGQSALQQLEESGIIGLSIWPLFLQKSSSSETTATGFDWDKASFVLLKLVNVRNAHLSKGDLNGPLSFMKPNQNTEKENAKNRAAFSKFLQTVVNLDPSQYPDTDVNLYHEIIQFLTMAYANLTLEMIPILQQPLLDLVGIGLWDFMPKRYRDLLISKSNAFKRRWMVHVEKHKDASSTSKVMHSFLPKVLKECLASLKVSTVNNDSNSNRNRNYHTIHSTIQLLIDLLSNTTTRRYLRPYILSIHLSTKFKLSTLYHNKMSKGNTSSNSNSNNVFKSLTDTLQQLESFAIEDISAAPLSSADMASIYHERAHILQKLCLRHYPDVLSDIVYAGVGMVANEGFLRKVLGRVVDDKDGTAGILIDLCHRLRLVDRDDEDVNDANCDNDDDDVGDDGKEGTDRKRRSEQKRFVLEVLIYHHSLKQSESKVLSELPLYPDEQLLWNPHLVPPGNPRYGSDDDSTVSLPKMSLQFLTFSDYLLRCFKLLRLESAYEIRSDLVDVVKRMRPSLRHGYNDDMDEEDMDEDEIWSRRRSLTEFHGWSRMGLELTEDTICPVRLVKVSPPKLGEKIPSEVLAEITLDLKHCGKNIRDEWDRIGEFDNLFLLGVDATRMDGGPAPMLEDEDEESEKRVPDEEDVTFPERFGVIAVRGCMVLEVRDDDGNILSDPSYVKGIDTKPKDSHKRFFKVALDPAQYAADATGSGSPFGTKVYQTLNVIVRRHGRENNFKAVLETVRSLMKGAGSVNRSVPRWLQPILLGYGNPASASFTSASMTKFAKNTLGVNSPDAALDYGDTFISEKHLRESFSDMSKTIIVDGAGEEGEDDDRKKYRVQIESNGDETIVKAKSYPFPPNINGNPVPFTPVQVKAIRSGLSPGLTMIVGPPGEAS